MITEIRPLDTLFFKDGKPFSMGEETWADGVFPPYPSVIFGALRTHFISQYTDTFSKNTIEESGKIKIQQIAYQLAHSGIYLPMPLDLAEPKQKPANQKKEEYKEKEYEVVRLRPELVENLSSNYPCRMVLIPPDGCMVEEVEQGLIESAEFMTYLNGNTNDFKIRKIVDFVQSEPKTGIGKDDFTNTASDAMLYRVGMRRASSFELLIDFEWPNSEYVENEPSFLIKLGAESKFAEVRRTRRTSKIYQKDVNLKPYRFKLYLATPAIFKKNGWHPDLASYNIKNTTLVAASIGKVLPIGGFDMKENKPKTMYKAVPAGSVFYYETTETPDIIMQALFGKAISEEMPEQGFGIAYIGNW